MVLEVAEPTVQILLQYINPFLETGGQIVLIDFQAVTLGLLVFTQPGQ